MPFYTFFWNEEPIAHLALNHVTPEQFETIVTSPERSGARDSTGRPAAFGYADDGRWLICVFEELDSLQILPVPAYESEEEE